jgi:hypothetical protein
MKRFKREISPRESFYQATYLPGKTTSKRGSGSSICSTTGRLAEARLIRAFIQLSNFWKVSGFGRKSSTPSMPLPGVGKSGQPDIRTNCLDFNCGSRRMQRRRSSPSPPGISMSLRIKSGRCFPCAGGVCAEADPFPRVIDYGLRSRQDGAYGRKRTRNHEQAL